MGSDSWIAKMKRGNKLFFDEDRMEFHALLNEKQLAKTKFIVFINLWDVELDPDIKALNDSILEKKDLSEDQTFETEQLVIRKTKDLIRSIEEEVTDALKIGKDDTYQMDIFKLADPTKAMPPFASLDDIPRIQLISDIEQIADFMGINPNFIGCFCP